MLSSQYMLRVLTEIYIRHLQAVINRYKNHPVSYCQLVTQTK